MNMMASHCETFGALGAADGAQTAARAWAVLHEAAAVAFALADGAAPAFPDGDPTGPGEGANGFAARFAAAAPERQAAVSRGLDDLAIVLEAGLGALLAASGQGGAIAPAAAVLAEEFLRARDGVMALLGPRERIAFLRSA